MATHVLLLPTTIFVDLVLSGKIQYVSVIFEVTSKGDALRSKTFMYAYEDVALLSCPEYINAIVPVCAISFRVPISGPVNWQHIPIIFLIPPAESPLPSTVFHHDICGCPLSKPVEKPAPAAIGVGVGVAVAVGFGVRVAVGRSVGVALGLGVAVGRGVTVGKLVGVALIVT